jgi:probable F420-dependent oxidoreductase
MSRYPPVTYDWEVQMQPDDFRAVARAADDLGFDSLAIPEHIAMPLEMAELMGRHFPHALTAMAFVAGATLRLTVDSSVIVLPYHQPLAFAKAVSTLDYLSGGRVRITVGVGHAEGEFKVLGVPFHQRGRITDEYLAAMIELWTSDEPTFHGEYVDFESIAFEPKPIQRPYPPIWVGGNSRAAMRRAARHDGWSPWLITPSQLPECLSYIHSLPEFDARTRPFDVAMSVSTLQVSEHHEPLEGDLGRRRVLSETQEVVDAIGHLQSLGVTWTSVPLPSTSVANYIEGLHWVAEEIMPNFR